MTKSPGHMKRLPVELGILTFVSERYRDLGITDDPMELFEQAARLRARTKRQRSRAKAAVPVGVIILIVGFGGLVTAIRLSSLNPATVIVGVAMVGVAWFLLDFGFRSEDRRRHRKRGDGHQKFDIESSEIFSKVFEPVEKSAYQLARISLSGASASFTPLSNRPIENAW